MYVSAKPERQRNLFRAGCRSAVRALPCAHIDRARTPTEGRTACPTLCFYIQDNDVHGGVRKRAAALHRFLGLSLRSARGRRASTEGRSVGKALPHFQSEPYISGRLFAYNIHAAACMFRQSPNAKGSAESRSALVFLYSRQRCSRRHANACRLSASFSWTFAVAPLVAAPRLLKGRRRGRARADFRIEPYARCAV